MKTILDGVLFVYASTNTSIAGIVKKKSNYYFVWLIMAISSAKSHVNGLKDKVWFWGFDLKN